MRICHALASWKSRRKYPLIKFRLKHDLCRKRVHREHTVHSAVTSHLTLVEFPTKFRVSRIFRASVSRKDDRRDNPDILYIMLNDLNNETMYRNFITFVEQSRDKSRYGILSQNIDFEIMDTKRSSLNFSPRFELATSQTMSEMLYNP